MPAIFDPETMNVDSLPGIWSPVQWELSAEEQAEEVEAQALASLLWVVDTPEAILRRLLDEQAIEQIDQPPAGYDPALQGDWDEEIITFQFSRKITLVSVERERDYLAVHYAVDGLGHWLVEITPTKATIEQI